MSIEDNKAIPRRYYEEAYNKGNIDIADKVFDKNVIGHTSNGEIIGTDAVKQFSSMMIKAFSDLKYTIEDQIAEGDKVVTRYTMTGKHKGEFMGCTNR